MEKGYGNKTIDDITRAMEDLNMSIEDVIKAMEDCSISGSRCVGITSLGDRCRRRSKKMVLLYYFHSQSLNFIGYLASNDVWAKPQTFFGGGREEVTGGS